MKTALLTTSEFANYIFHKFPEAIHKTDYMTALSVYKRGGYPVLSVHEPKSGKTRIEINGKRYSAMNAAEKREAIHFIDHFEFDIVVSNDVCCNRIRTMNYVTGTYIEGQEFNVVGGNTLWYRIEKVTHVR